MNAKGHSMTGKWFVLTWVVVVLGTLSYMQFVMFDKARGKPNPTLMAAAGPLDDIKNAADKAARDAKKATDDAKNAVDAVKNAADKAASGAKMVQPESLEQGFIVVVNDKSKIASSSSPIYMPSSHNGWNPGDQAMKLEAQSDMKWRIIWSKPKLDSRVAFKFARGSWDAVETKADFSDVDNRMLPMVDVSKLKPGEKPVIEFEIETWKDKTPGLSGAGVTPRYRKVTVGAGRLERVEVVGGGAKPGASRDLLVWLPPGYDDAANKSVTYPVLYLNDGQNVFDVNPGTPGEWEADETAAKLIASGKVEPMIIVGIPHSSELRSQEYMPVAGLEKVEPKGQAYIEFIVSEVMPKVDRLYRTKTGPEHTAIGGASLGAVISMAAAQKHPEKFGSVLLESMPLRIGNGAVFRSIAAVRVLPRRMYIGVGGKEGGLKSDAGTNTQFVEANQALVDMSKAKGMTDANLMYVVDQDAVHNEGAWAKRFGPALEFLFPLKK